MAVKDKARRVCQSCNRSKSLDSFYKTNSPILFPDGKLNVCTECVKREINFDDSSQVINFLRQIDRPFYLEQWEKAKAKGTANPLSAYLSVVGVLKQYSDKKFDDSDGITNSNQMISSVDSMTTEDDDGEKIVITNSIMEKWGKNFGYTVEQYMKLEQFYRNMKKSYEINTPTLEVMLMDICRLNVDKETLLSERNYGDYERVSRAFNKSMQDAGFRPIDKKDALDEMGLTSFGEVVAQIERTGFIPPKRIEYEKDDIDMMLLYYTQWAQHFTNSAVDTEPNENWRDQVDLSEDLFLVDELSNIEDAEKDYAVEAIDEALEEISKFDIVEDAYDGEE